MGRIEKILSFEGLQELHSGFGYASASIPFLQAFKGSEIFTTFVKMKTNLYTQKGILPKGYQWKGFFHGRLGFASLYDCKCGFQMQIHSPI